MKRRRTILGSRDNAEQGHLASPRTARISFRKEHATNGFFRTAIFAIAVAALIATPCAPVIALRFADQPG
nr:hypothetical protein [uncultured Methanoregula sp.]